MAAAAALQTKLGDGKQTPTDPKTRESQVGSGKRGAIARIIAIGHQDSRGWQAPGTGAGWEQWIPTGSQASGSWQWWQALPPSLAWLGMPHR